MDVVFKYTLGYLLLMNRNMMIQSYFELLLCLDYKRNNFHSFLCECYSLSNLKTQALCLSQLKYP